MFYSMPSINLNLFFFFFLMKLRFFLWMTDDHLATLTSNCWWVGAISCWCSMWSSPSSSNLVRWCLSSAFSCHSGWRRRQRRMRKRLLCCRSSCFWTELLNIPTPLVFRRCTKCQSRWFSRGRTRQTGRFLTSGGCASCSLRDKNDQLKLSWLRFIISWWCRH